MYQFAPINIELRKCVKNNIRINVSWNDYLEDAYFLSLTSKTIVVNIGSYQTINLFTRTDLYEKVPDELSTGIYSSDINVFRGPNYDMLNIPFNIDIVSVPIIKNHTIYTTIFETLFYFVSQHPEITNLVFMPIGYGIFGYDPNKMASFFNTYLKLYHFGNISNIIISCGGKDDNYRAFKYHMTR